MHFDAEIEPKDAEFDGKKSIRYQHIVMDPNQPDQPDKYFTVSKRNSALIDTYLTEGQSILKIIELAQAKTLNMLSRLHDTNSFAPLFTGLTYYDLASIKGF